ncbi:MAG: alpha/beta fold hydrolase [Dehalococcoidia bacterium]
MSIRKRRLIAWGILAVAAVLLAGFWGPQDAARPARAQVDEGEIVVIEEGLAPVDAGFAEANGARLWYEVYGEGEPLLLISGLGGNHLGWADQVPVYASEFEVIVFDNRGTGQSSFPEGVDLTMPLLADDPAALLDALAVDAAHVYGVSMGGMIAQEMALRHPEKIRSLILGCTTPGGPQSVPAQQWAVEALFAAGEQGIADSGILEVMFSPGYLAEHRSEVIEGFESLADYPATPAEVFAAQIQAIGGHDTYDRLPGITAPTLVLHGADDPLVPTANGRILAERIPGAELVLLEGARHGYFIEKQAETDAVVLDFLRVPSWEAAVPAPAMPAAGSNGLLAKEKSGVATWWYALAAGGALLVMVGLAGLSTARSRR